MNSVWIKHNNKIGIFKSGEYKPELCQKKSIGFKENIQRLLTFKSNNLNKDIFILVPTCRRCTMRSKNMIYSEVTKKNIKLPNFIRICKMDIMADILLKRSYFTTIKSPLAFVHDCSCRHNNQMNIFKMMVFSEKI